MRLSNSNSSFFRAYITLSNLDNTSYTESEKDGGFELRYIPLSNVEEELKKNAEEYGDKKGIAREMLELFSLYKN